MVGTRSTQEEMRNEYETLLKGLKRRDHVLDLGVDSRPRAIETNIKKQGVNL